MNVSCLSHVRGFQSRFFLIVGKAFFTYATVAKLEIHEMIWFHKVQTYPFKTRLKCLLVPCLKNYLHHQRGATTIEPYTVQLHKMLLKIRRWVARNFTVWRTHTRTLIIFSHSLAHRTSFFDDRTHTRTCTFSYPYTVKSQEEAFLV